MRMTIEKALGWAYREELPREQVDLAASVRLPGMANASGPMAGFLDNPSAAVDVPLNRWGVVGVRDLFGRGPHPDAVQIGLAVDALCAEAVTMPGPQVVVACGRVDGARGCDLGEWMLWSEAYARAAARLPRRLKDVIVRRALAPDPEHWRGDAPAVVPERDQFGNARWYRMTEREAVTRRGQKMGATERCEMIVNVAREPGRRPRKGDYQKFRLEPDPVWMLEARAVYSAWRAALDVLCEDLVGRMKTVALLPSEAAREPWVVVEDHGKVMEGVG